MGQHFTLGAGPVQIMGQHVLPRLYGCRRLWHRLNARVSPYPGARRQNETKNVEYLLNECDKATNLSCHLQSLWIQGLTASYSQDCLRQIFRIGTVHYAEGL